MTEQSNYASADALAGLASEVEGLRKRTEPLTGLPGKVQTLAANVEGLAAQLAEFIDRGGPDAAASWLGDEHEDPEMVARLIGGLVEWLDRVFLAWPDAVRALPACWVWHPHVVEELLASWQLWLTAYTGKTASATGAGDWLDRYRPGVVRRLTESVGSCSLERHTTPQAPSRTPLAEQVDNVITAWCTARDQAPPVPTAEQFAAAPQRGVIGSARLAELGR